MINIKINDFHTTDIKNEIHPSMFTSNDDYDVLILRLPFLCENKLVSKSSAYVFTKNEYLFYDKETSSFLDLKNINGLYETLNEKINIVMTLTSDIYEEIEIMEDIFYEKKHIENFNQVWFSKKNDLIRINRLLNKAILEFKKFILKCKKESDFLEIHFDDLTEHLERTSRKSLHALEKLDALYNFYISNNNENMNKTMYVLTVLSGIFLPLNLIVGFFGMNTTSLPFTKEEFGTHFVIGLLISIVVLMFTVNFLIKKYKNIKI